MTQNIKEFDLYSKNYNNLVNDSISFSGLTVDFFTLAKIYHIRQLLRNNFTFDKKIKLFDIGCGVGNYHSYIKNYVDKIYGTDVSSECLEVAKQKNPNNIYEIGQDSTLPFHEETFDFAMSVCVFHHIEIQNRQSIANNIYKRMEKDGIFAIFEHNPYNPLTMRVVNNCEFDVNAVLLKASETENLLKKAGFNDIKTRYILTVPAKEGILMKIDKLFSKVPLGAQYYTYGKKC